MKKKKQPFAKLVERMEKRFGKGALMALSGASAERTAVIPTGSLSLDNALGINGFPVGRVIEIFGPESSGQTTLALHAIAEAQYDAFRHELEAKEASFRDQRRQLAIGEQEAGE